ncbi:MAG: hypothetical protein JXA97_13830 [Anaerolineales bacterium]|nr:hypothetical protein [Anaerolineales bacterium]
MTNTPQRENKRLNMRWMMMGGLLAAAFFLVQAGAAEIFLSRNAVCLANADQLRIDLLPEEICMPAWQELLLTGAASGILGVFLRSAPWLGWVLTGGLYFALGVGVTQIRPRIGLTVFLMAHLFMIVIAAMLAYISQYIL